jgi:transposase
MGPEEVAKAVALSEDGRSVRYIAEALGFPRSTVNNVIRLFNQTGSYKRSPGSGPKRCTDERDDRFMRMCVLRDRGMTSNIVAQRLANVRQTNVSSPTVRRRLKSFGLTSRKPATAPLLLPHHRRARLNFAMEHTYWTEEQWGSVLFTDESRFTLRSPDGRERVWRRQGERYAACCISPRTPFGGGGVMVWGGISLEARTELVIVERSSITARRYITECLQDHVVPYAEFLGENFILMQDNARPHTAGIVRQYLNEVGIVTLPWPARSPDMNPIEHVWDELGRRIRHRENIPETIPSLRIALQEAWEQLPQDVIANLIRSVPRRLETLIAARGGNTRY